MEGCPFTGHTGWVNSVAFSHDGQRIVSCSLRDGTIRVWNTTKGAMDDSPFIGHTTTSFIHSVAFSQDGQKIISSFSDGTIRVCLLATLIRSRLSHSRRMGNRSPQVLLMAQFICGTPRRERLRATHLLGTPVWSDPSHSRRTDSGSSLARMIAQFVCGTPRQGQWWEAHLLGTLVGSDLLHSRRMGSGSFLARTITQFVCGTLGT